MSTSVSFSTVDLIVKQVKLDALHEVGQAAIHETFNGFVAKGMTEETQRQRREQIVELLGGEERASGTEMRFDLTYRRFDGDPTLSRGRYYSISVDEAGYDNSTLCQELLAYYEPKQPGWVAAFDLSMVEHRTSLSSWFDSMPESELRRLDLDGSALVIVFTPLNGRPHPFATRFTDRVAPFLVTIPTEVKRVRMDRVIDLRDPSTASWFTREMTQWRVELDGKEVSMIPAKPPLQEFRDLIPTLLEQSRGGASRATMSSAGLRLRQLGANGLIFPSARADSFVEVRKDQVEGSSGWNLVDYRGASEPQMTAIIDMDVEWPTEVGFHFPYGEMAGQQMVYGGVNIDYTERGSKKGSWSVSGLAIWQQAWFRATCALSVLEALDRDLHEEVSPYLQFLWLQQESGASLLEAGDSVLGTMLGEEESANRVRAWASAFKNSDCPELATALQKLITAFE
jgi:hypothetical protein